MKQKQLPDIKEVDNPYWLSFSDAMSGMLIIFILATLSLMLISNKENKRLQAQIDSDRIIKKEMTEQLFYIQQNLKQKGVTIYINDGGVMHIPSEVFSFPTNSATIPPEKEMTVCEIGKQVYDLVKNHDYIDTVFIEGHTDCRDTNWKDGNWGLSTARAISVWKKWQDKKICNNSGDFSSLTNNGEPIFSVSGYADTRPINRDKNCLDLKKEGPTPEILDVMQQNRRIDIRFVLKRKIPSIVMRK